MSSEFLLVAEKIFRQERRPMSARQLVDYARDNGLFSDHIAGRTPHQTMKAKLSVEIRRRGVNSKFVRTKPGKFFLRELAEGRMRVYEAVPIAPPLEQRPVLVFPSELLDKIGRFQGIKRSWKKIAKELFASGKCQYLNRLDAEGNDSFKQVLTYIMVRSGNSLLGFKRGTYNRVEEFLRGSQCIGFGGHVSEVDRDLFNQDDYGVLQSARRELSEELNLPLGDMRNILDGSLSFVGVLNDDSSAVGRRHFAFVLEYRISDQLAWSQPRRGEKSITQLRWIDPASTGFSLWDFEYWSQLCLREFFSPSLKAHPAYRIRRRVRLIPPSLLLVLGPAGSGKSEATRILKEDFGYREINSGQTLARILGIPPVPQTPRLEFQEAAWRFITSEGSPQVLAESIWRSVCETNWERVLIDGVRQIGTVEALRGLAAGSRRLGSLYVHTPPDIAYRFFRDRQSSNVGVQEFLQMRESPVERDVESMIAGSDAVLYNWTGRPEYRKVIHDLMAELGITRL